VGSGDLVRTSLPRGPIGDGLVVQPNGKWLAGADGFAVDLWENSGELRKTLALRSSLVSVTAMVFSVDGKSLITGSNDGVLQVTDLATEENTPAIEFSQPITTLALIPGDRSLAVGTMDGRIATWNTSNWTRHTRMQSMHDGSVNALIAARNQTILSGGRDGTVRLWDAATGKEMRRMRHEDRVWSIDLSPDLR
jgi:WD40 repeat protein